MNITGVELTEEHIGSKVTYIPPHANGDASHADAEGGTILRWNDRFVFVDFGKGTPASVASSLLVWG